MKNELEPIVNKLNDLFILERNHYIVQNDDGSYARIRKTFHDYLLINHLQHKNTYGIFCGEEITKFLTFDVDVPVLENAQQVVRNLYSVLNQMGIPNKYIYTSWSGTKGYHVDIYFSKIISIRLMMRLFEYAKSKVMEISGDFSGNIECRPWPTQGLKLPLGIHKKNQDPSSNICWYVSVENDFAYIMSFEYVLDIEPVDVEQILKIIKRIPIKEKKIKLKKIADNNYENYIIGETIESIDLLFKNGLKQSGTRHQTLCKCALLIKSRGLSKEECEEQLIEWMNVQNTNFYNTPLKQCYKEIKRIVENLYAKNFVLIEQKNEIYVTRNEILTIHQYPKKYHKTLNALFFHSKRFMDANNQFFMTYEQIAAGAKCSVRTAKDHVKSLEEIGVISVTRSPLFYVGDMPFNHPNTYRLDFNWLKDEKDSSVLVEVNKPEEYSKKMITIIIEAFPDNEWYVLSNLVKRALLNSK